MLLRTFLSNYRIILHTTDINAEKFTLGFVDLCGLIFVQTRGNLIAARGL